MSSTIIELTWLILLLVLGFCGGYTICMYRENNMYFNSNAKDKDSYGFLPEFEVTDIELSYDKNTNRIARYTVINAFHAKKNFEDFRYQTFYFYDKLDAYKIGDKLTLAKLMK